VQIDRSVLSRRSREARFSALSSMVSSLAGSGGLGCGAIKFCVRGARRGLDDGVVRGPDVL